MEKIVMVRICAGLLALVSICFSQQTSNVIQGSITDGESIVRKAREAAGLSSQMTLFRIKLHEISTNKLGETAPVKTQGKEIVENFLEEFTIMSPNKIRMVYDLKNNLLAGSMISIWNENRLKKTLEFEINGERRVRDVTEPLSTERINSVLNKSNSKKIDIKPIDNRASFRHELWTSVFPFILMHPIESNAKFEYIGRAKAGEQIANFVETRSADGNVFQLFFDEKTSNLLLLIEKGNNGYGDFEDKYYFSNREKRDNVLIPTKVKYERKFMPTNGGVPSITYRYIDIEGFEVNPEINKGLFDIK